MAEIRSPGRPRDATVDEAILRAAKDLLAEGGVDAVSFTAVAERAGTTRPALYRRYADRTELAIAAIASMSAMTAPAPTGDFRADLIAELRSFEAGITALKGVGLAAMVLADATAPAVKAAYRVSVVTPRRKRIAAILRDAARAGEVSASVVDQKTLVTMATGSWYAFALAGTTPPRDWAERTASLLWTAAGGAA